MKTFSKKDVFSIANAEDAKKYIGHECYFEDSYAGLQYCIDNDIKVVLKDINKFDGDHVDCIFVVDRSIELMDSRCFRSFGLCLPCELIKMEEEPKYRAFKSIEEFKSVVGEMGSVIHFKPINCNANYCVIFSGILETEFGGTNVSLGAMVHDFAELFEDYTLIRNGEEVPFGIKD